MAQQKRVNGVSTVVVWITDPRNCVDRCFDHSRTVEQIQSDQF